MYVKNVKTFIKVAELGSFTKAAEELCYVQSTVTIQIKQLEKELGVPLFDRVGRKIFLTAAGEEFLTLAYELVNMLSSAEKIGGGNKQSLLRIGVSESLLFAVITDLLPKFKKKCENVSLNIKTGHRIDDLFEDLKHNRLDMVFVSSVLNTEPLFACHYVCKEQLVFVCGREHPLAKEKNIPFSELAKHDFLVTEKEGTCHKCLRAIAAEQGENINIAAEIDNVFVIAELAKKGMGLALLPEYCVSEELKNKSLVKLSVDVDEQPYYSQLLCHKNRWLSPDMREFIDFLKLHRPENKK